MQDQGTTVAASGHVAPGWKPVAKRWASIMQLVGREAFYVQQVQPLATHSVRIRHVEGLTSKHRLRFKEKGRTERTLSILTIDNVDQRSIEQVVTCQETL